MTDATPRPLLPELVHRYLHGDPANAWPGKLAKHPANDVGHSEALNVEYALKHLVEASVDLPAGDERATRHGQTASSRHLADLRLDQLRPSDLRHVQARLVKLGRARTYINRTQQRILRFVAWAVSMEYVGPDVLRGLETVDRIPAGEHGVKHTERIESVKDRDLERVRSCASWLLRQAMRVQELAGMRPGELIGMRVCDIHRVEHEGEILWEYRPRRHKTAHRGFSRLITLPLEAQEIIRRVVDYLWGQDALTAPDEHGRAVPLIAGAGVPRLGDHTDQRRLWWREAGGPTGRAEGWRTTRSYGKAIERAARRGGVHMTANQLRKRRATFAFVEADAKTAAKVLGHASEQMTLGAYIDRSAQEERAQREARQFAIQHPGLGRVEDLPPGAG